MEGALILLGLVMLAIPVAVIYLLVSHARLRTRVAVLETELATQVMVADSTPDTARTVPPKPVERPKPEQPTKAAEAQTSTPWTPPAKPSEQAPIAPNTPPELAPPSLALRAVHWAVANWFYVVSAVSLALAGLFLVQYGVENGLFPPGARVLAALGFGGALIAGGEVIRRRFGDDPEHATAYLPSVFSGAGLVSLFGGIAAAHLLYGLIGAEVAFVGMAAVGVLGVGLGWLHGPLLAVVGVVGAFAAPFLVAGTVPAQSWLYIYFAIITALGLGIDTIRRWAWVSGLSVALGFGAGWLSAQSFDLEMILGFQAHVVVMVLMATLIPARGLRPDHGGAMIIPLALGQLGRVAVRWPGFPTLLAGAAVATASAALLWTGTLGAEPFWMAVLSLVLLAVALTAWSTTAPALQDLIVLPVLALFAVVAIEGNSGGPVVRAFAATYDTNPEADFPLAATLLWAIGLGLSAMAAGRALRDGAVMAWALAAALIGPVLAVVIEVTWTPANTIGAYPWALHAMLTAVVMVGLALRFARIDGMRRDRVALFVLSALACMSFAFVLILTLAALTVALALTVVAAAALDRRFDLRLMQLFVVVGVAAVSTRLVADPGLAWALDAPLWEVLLAYAGALAAFCAALWLQHPRGRVAGSLVLDTGAWSVAGLLMSVLLFRAIEAELGEDGTFSHWGFGLFAVIWLGLMLAQLVRMQRLGGALGWVRGGLALVFGLIGGLVLVAGLTVLSPLVADWGSRVSGPPVLNTLAVAYALPALLLALGATRLRAGLLRTGMWGVAGALGVYWAFAALRHLWQGAAQMPLDNGFLQPELYSYTVALLVAGAALFYQALARGSVMLRRAGLVVIGLAVAKVFLIDISGLEGLTRVLSLMVLGLSLAGLAWLNRWAQSRA
ncbi:DUF2339 domain-containing protein [uncultured Tateyamaria sp.]|uniref:DUF2339 domain-containing protein n=1 Tax=uncultured Tateyamaria sp. TaxID=455651 RepID=UPI00260649C5|nr:DUF2339 domain-containing protein [uncultured Tateyamaria sp.]